MLLTSVVTVFIVFFILSFIFSCLNKYSNNDSMFSSPFECGFTSFFISRISFSVHYFFVAIIFLFLDLELCVLFPGFLMDFCDWKIYASFSLFLLSVLVALLLEWSGGKIEWQY